MTEIYNLFENSKKVFENKIQYILKILKGSFLGHAVVDTTLKLVMNNVLNINTI